MVSCILTPERGKDALGVKHRPNNELEEFPALCLQPHDVHKRMVGRTHVKVGVVLVLKLSQNAHRSVSCGGEHAHDVLWGR